MSVSFSSACGKGRHLAGWLLPLLLGCIPVASATDVVFTGGSYSRDGSTVTLTMDSITNNDFVNSGDLRMELWAYPSPYQGQSGEISTGFQLAISPSLGSLGADSHFTASPITETAAFVFPPDGTYYITLFLEEYQGGPVNDGYESTDYGDFSDTVTFSTPVATNGAAFGFSSAVSVGNGYYYDSDLGYLYSFGDGWIYDSDLNKYLYANPGDDFTTGIYLFDLTRNSWTYTAQSFWPYVYYFNGTGWVDTGYN